ncbi:MAG: hypothetical protein HY721_33045, partial [Planctomycetes bacterium]|nr:hypothetical protein [Planctomycetota bacterium]
MSPWPLLLEAASSGPPDWLLRLFSVDAERVRGGAAHLRFARFPEGGLGLLAILAILASCAFVVWNYRREGALARWKKLGLAGIRSAVITALAVAAFYPVLEVDRVEDLRAVTLLLVDESLSQGIQDRYQGDPARRDAAARALGMAPEDVASARRADLVARALSSPELKVLEGLARSNRLKAYAFSSLPLAPVALPEPAVPSPLGPVPSPLGPVPSPLGPVPSPLGPP